MVDVTRLHRYTTAGWGGFHALYCTVQQQEGIGGSSSCLQSCRLAEHTHPSLSIAHTRVVSTVMLVLVTPRSSVFLPRHCEQARC